MVRHRSLGSPSDADGQYQGRRERSGIKEKIAQQCPQKRQYTVLQHIPGARPFQLVIPVYDLGIPSAQRNPLYFKALPFQRKNFASNKAGGDDGVLIYEIGNSCGHITSVRAPSLLIL